LHNHLLANIADSLHVLVWQGGERKRRDFPEAIERQGNHRQKEIIGDATPVDELLADNFLPGFEDLLIQLNNS